MTRCCWVNLQFRGVILIWIVVGQGPTVYAVGAVGGCWGIVGGWVNLQCWGVILIWMVIGQGPTVHAVGAVGGCLDIFLSSDISLFFLPLSGRRLVTD